MDWDIGGCPVPPSDNDVFNQLLDKLRSVFEEACKRDRQSEPQNGHRFELTAQSHNATPNHVHSQSQHLIQAMFEVPPEDDPWLPSNFMPPKEGAPPRRPPRRAGAPMTFDLHATESFGKQQEYLGQSIENLAKQQADLSRLITSQHQYLRQIAKAVIKPAGHNRFTTMSASSKWDRASGTERLSSAQLKPSISMNGQSTSMIMKEKKTVQIAGFEDKKEADAKKRFAVETGATKDLSHRRRWTVVPHLHAHWFDNMRKHLQKMLNGTVFSLISTLLIFSYAALIAVETHIMSMSPGSDNSTIQTLHHVYIGIWCLELLLRFIADGFKTWTGPDGLWNKLDAFFILSGFTEIALENVGSATAAGSVVRGVRICRVIRTVRLVRTFRQFHEFQKMAYALLSSFKTLLCSLLLLMFVMFFFAVWFTQSTADKEARRQIQDLDLRYGNLGSTTYTLFLSVSGGISWDVCYLPLHQLSWWSAQGFILYIIVVLFGVLNVVTSVFVESVIRSVQHYKDLIVQDVEEERKIAISHIQEVFRHIDSDGSGQVSIDEMEHFLGDQSLRRYMEALDIDAADTRMLFKLLDYDGSGVICIGEFCEGCLRLKGSAKSIDIHALNWQVKNFLAKWGDFTDFVEESFDTIKTKLH